MATVCLEDSDMLLMAFMEEKEKIEQCSLLSLLLMVLNLKQYSREPPINKGLSVLAEEEHSDMAFAAKCAEGLLAWMSMTMEGAEAATTIQPSDLKAIPGKLNYWYSTTIPKGDYWPSLMVEVGWSQKYKDLLKSVNIWLLDERSDGLEVGNGSGEVNYIINPVVPVNENRLCILCPLFPDYMVYVQPDLCRAQGASAYHLPMDPHSNGIGQDPVLDHFVIHSLLYLPQVVVVDEVQVEPFIIVIRS
ncbi:hypothetical protein BV22DRAFT_1051578 [Leucogyrophana mollusca]|uniref:Uncharacterized protein n=1 Tax=Leucogyrophana mollusca TaxID=85980 RepID=A0ACB8B0C4_9AGAM|nr:hypothetical protein BV22DRAFT_1051578 [Leucogyrophana mollusca]